MNILLLMVLIMATVIVLFIGFIIYRQYVFLPNKRVRVIMYLATGGLRFMWGKYGKEDESFKDFSILIVDKKPYYYLPIHIKPLGRFKCIELYENNFHALTNQLVKKDGKFDPMQVKHVNLALHPDFSRLEKESSLTLHPNIIGMMLRSKLIKELLEKDINWQDIVLLINAFLTLCAVGAMIYYFPQLMKSIAGLKDAIAQNPIETAKLIFPQVK